jgi:hypothetical protein
MVGGLRLEVRGKRHELTIMDGGLGFASNLKQSDPPTSNGENGGYR